MQRNCIPNLIKVYDHSKNCKQRLFDIKHNGKKTKKEKKKAGKNLFVVMKKWQKRHREEYYTKGFEPHSANVSRK